MLVPDFTSTEGKAFIRQCLSASSTFHKEVSIKLEPNQLIDKRVLFGFDKADKSTKEWADFIAGFNPPSTALQRFFQLSADANAFLFGIEETPAQTTCKIYLEYWQQLVELIHTSKHQQQPFPLNRGLKWKNNDPQKWVEDIYWCHPMLSIEQIQQRLKLLLEGQTTLIEKFLSDTLLTHEHIIGDMLIYLEITAAEHQRRSFDINCYKANLKLSDIKSDLLQIAEKWKISEQLSEQLPQIRQLPLGHISGGVDRNNSPFLTLYLEA